MFGFSKSRSYTIGVDVGDECVRLVQLAENGKGMKLVAGRSSNRPEDMPAGGSQWQRWAIQTIKAFTGNGDFNGKSITAAIPASELFIDHIRISKAHDEDIENVAFGKIKQRLPFEADRERTMIQCVRTNDENVVVMAADRKVIDRHLAIYEQANLRIKAIGVWPEALISCYTKFFGRRQSDLDAVVMLLSVDEHRTNVVICRHRHLLFAKSIPVGAKDFEDESAVTRLVMELNGCRRQFCSMHRNVQIERLIFLVGRSVDREICASIARQLEMPAQTGDCLAAVQIANPYRLGIDRRADSQEETTAKQKQNWATAFGLSLS
ncbi:MAG: hypothetical protein JW720_03280 [Sedimentisphaerales bacterium]|nr:hypothetical protein [Sedimentisphaerales bacterium]